LLNLLATNQVHSNCRTLDCTGFFDHSTGNPIL
jgi:hypothetical protein